MNRSTSKGRRFGTCLAIVLASLFVASIVQATPFLDPCSGGDCVQVNGVFPGNDKSSGPDKSLNVDLATGMDLHLVPVAGDNSFNIGSYGTMGMFTLTNDGDGLSGTWSYAGTMGIDYISVKAGRHWTLWEYSPSAMGGLWSTIGLLASENQAQLSHITFWTTQTPPPPRTPVPEPSTLLLLCTSLAGLVIWRKTRK